MWNIRIRTKTLLEQELELKYILLLKKYKSIPNIQLI